MSPAQGEAALRRFIGAVALAAITACSIAPHRAVAQAQAWPPVGVVPDIGNGAHTRPEPVLWSLDGGATYSDNVTLSPSNGRSDTILQAGGVLDVDHQGPRDSVVVHGSGSFLHYEKNTYGDDFVGGGSADADYQLIPHFLTWRLQDSFGQVLADTLQPSTPTNRENINVFSTGPDMQFALSPALSLLVQARYGRTLYQKTPADNNRYSGTIALLRALSPSSSLGINLRASRVEYSVAGDSPYDVEELYGSWQIKGIRTTANLELGAALYRKGGMSKTSPMMLVDLQRRLTPHLSVTLDGGIRFIEPSDRFSVLQQAGLQQGTLNPRDPADIVATAQALRDDYASLSLAYAFARTIFSVGSIYGVERYQTNGLSNRNHVSANAHILRRITPQLTGEIFGSWERRQFDSLGSEDRTRTAGATVSWRLGRTLTLKFVGESVKREPTGPSAIGYTDNLGGINLIFSPTPSGAH